MRELHPVLVLVLVVYGRARQEADPREEGQPNRQQVLRLEDPSRTMIYSYPRERRSP